MLTKVLTGEMTFTSLKPLDLTACTKPQIKKYFENSYDLNESLFTALKDDSVFYKRPDNLRLPLIFYYGHTAAVYINKLMLSELIQDRVNLEFETLFETGVDEMSWDDTENYRMGGNIIWPRVEDVIQYRGLVRNKIIKVIEKTPLELPITMESPWWSLLMGMEHERIHLETSSVLIRQLPIELVSKPDGWVYGPVKHVHPVNENPMVAVEESEAIMGKPWNFPSYGWDNEYGEVQCNVPSFKATKYLITNRAFLDFIDDGGYIRKELWTDEGWKWKSFRQAKHPTFWVCEHGCKSGCGAALASYSHCNFPKTSCQNIHEIRNNGDLEINGSSSYGSESEQTNDVSNGHNNNGFVESGFRYRAMFDVIDMPLDWPVEVNYHEAKAYCAWRGPGYRLPAEAEHHIMRGNTSNLSQETSCDIIFQDNIKSNLNLKYGSSTPVNMFPPSSTGFCDVFGNVWEWTEDQFNGLCGYKSHYLYDDFSAPCFDGRHNIIQGGSWISTGDEASRFARFAFRRHFFQHLGFRVVRSCPYEEKVHLPVRVVDSNVFVLGLGVQENPIIYFDKEKVEVQKTCTTNLCYAFDNRADLDGILELEFGYRESGFASVISSVCEEYASTLQIGKSSAAIMGIDGGLVAFLMSKYFSNVLGIDFSAHLIAQCKKLQTERHARYRNSRNEIAEIMLDDDIDTSKTIFKQLTWLPNEVGFHDIALVTFLERTPEPRAWLSRLWEITRPTGLAIIASKTGTWNQETLQPELGRRLHCIRSQQVPFTGVSGEEIATVTTWRRL